MAPGRAWLSQPGTSSELSIDPASSRAQLKAKPMPWPE